jgi:hypothetical protein
MPLATPIVREHSTLAGHLAMPKSTRRSVRPPKALSPLGDCDIARRDSVSSMPPLRAAETHLSPNVDHLPIIRHAQTHRPTYQCEISHTNTPLISNTEYRPGREPPSTCGPLAKTLGLFPIPPAPPRAPYMRPHRQKPTHAPKSVVLSRAHTRNARQHTTHNRPHFHYLVSLTRA